MAAAWNELPASGGLNECAALVRSAEALCVSAPELAVQLARRALLVGASNAAWADNAGDARSLVMRAQAVLTAGLVRISQHIDAVEPGFTALALAEVGGAADLAMSARLDLASCAREVGEPLLGGALLRPVLEGGQVRPSVRAAALSRLVGCVAHVARRDDVEDALAEADRLLAADDGLSTDTRRMERAWLSARTAAYHRWYGDTEDAVTAAREGLTLLNRLRRELRAESDRLRAQLVLELVCALLDEGELGEADAAASPTVDEPVRATSAAAVAQLMMAVATRVCLPGGQVDRGRGLLDQAAWIAERHGLDSVLADAQTEVSRLDERAGRTTDALVALRVARAAEQRRLRGVARAARVVLTEVGAGRGAKDVTRKTVTTLLRQLAHPAGAPMMVTPLPPARTSPQPQLPAVTGEPANSLDTDKGTGLLNREGLFRRLRSVRTGERPVALTLVRFEQNGDGRKSTDTDRGPDTGIMAELADRVRDMAPEHAELARSDGRELAVLLPHTTRDEAEEFAATIRDSDWLADSSKDVSISTGVVQSGPSAPGDDSHVDAGALLTAARDALTPAPEPPSEHSQPEPPSSALSEETPTTPRPSPHPRGALAQETPTTPLDVARASESLTVGRSILSSLSIPTGSGGRRRAGGEPPPNTSTSWPPSPAVTPTRAQADQSPPATGWPAEPDLSQPLRREKPRHSAPAATNAAPPAGASTPVPADTGTDPASKARTNAQNPGASPTTAGNTPAEGTTTDPHPSAASTAQAAEPTATGGFTAPSPPTPPAEVSATEGPPTFGTSRSTASGATTEGTPQAGDASSPSTAYQGTTDAPAAVSESSPTAEDGTAGGHRALNEDHPTTSGASGAGAPYPGGTDPLAGASGPNPASDDGVAGGHRALNEDHSTTSGAGAPYPGGTDPLAGASGPNPASDDGVAGGRRALGGSGSAAGGASGAGAAYPGGTNALAGASGFDPTAEDGTAGGRRALGGSGSAAGGASGAGAPYPGGTDALSGASGFGPAGDDSVAGGRRALGGSGSAASGAGAAYWVGTDALGGSRSAATGAGAAYSGGTDAPSGVSESSTAGDDGVAGGRRALGGDRSAVSGAAVAGAAYSGGAGALGAVSEFGPEGEDGAADGRRVLGGSRSAAGEGAAYSGGADGSGGVSGSGPAGEDGTRGRRALGVDRSAAGGAAAAQAAGTGGSVDPSASSAPADATGHASGAEPRSDGLTSAAAGGETGAVAAANDSGSSAEQELLDAAQRSTYEETKLELARLMSALDAGAVPAADEPRNGFAPQLSIPTPPEPDEVPEPARRPDIPTPPEPDPIPPVPAEPGPSLPDETGPPPSARWELSNWRASFNAEGGGRSDDLPKRTRSNSWTSAFDTPFASPDDPEKPSSGFDPFGTGLETPVERRVEDVRSAFGVSQEKSESKGDGRAPFTSALGAAFDAAGQAERAPAPRPRPRPDDEVPGAQPHELPPRRERSDSTTIAGLLAEALAAYQSTGDDADDAYDPPAMPEPPNKPEPPTMAEPPTMPDRSRKPELEPFGGLDKLLDDRQQSGATGRHRSPE